MRVETRGEHGPICPVCGTDVEEAGHFCTETCFEHFVRVVSDQPGIVEMEKYLDKSEQPWSTRDQDG